MRKIFNFPACAGRQLSIFIFTLFMIFLFAQFAGAATRLGLHVTQEELNIWKQRAVSGPYKNAGDASTNSPGDWTRIQANANAFLSNPSADRWSGPTSACQKMWTEPGYTQPLPEQNRRLGDKLRDAGFYYLVTGNTAYRDAVRAELLAQAATPGTNFADSSRWCSNISGDGNPIFDINYWLTKLLFGYDYVRSSLSSADRATLDTWFNSAGIFFENAFNNPILARFPNRYSENPENYTINGGYIPMPQVQCSPTHYGGWNACDWHELINNRESAVAQFIGLAGIETGNTYLQDSAKRYVKEAIIYGTFPDNMMNDYKRWTDSWGGLYDTTHGWSYSTALISNLVSIADAFARTGDTSLYDYSTSAGIHGTAGGPKSLYGIVRRHQSFVNNSTLYYASYTATTDPKLLIDTIDDRQNAYEQVSRNGDIDTGPQANLYYKDPFITSIYTRKASGAPAYPSNISTGGNDPWGATYPGHLFMFGQMEGRVNPFGGTIIPPLRIPGDINGDGTVNSLDWSLMSGKWLTNDISADLNKDGAVNSLDWSIMSGNWLKTI